MEKTAELPELGDDAGEKAEVSFWYVTAGENVQEDDDMVEMVTDKAAFTVPAPFSGTIKEQLTEEGDTVEVGDPLALMEV
ncbi:MAG: lipoyl domain-containing protein [Planctomycetota bacterium]